MKRVYLDNAATTRVNPQIAEEMTKYYTEIYGNPSSLYEEGSQAGKVLMESRERMAKALNCSPDEVIFTSCGSESDNYAILGTVQKLAKKGKHIITSKIEHHAILHTLEHLEKQGYEVTYLDVYDNGIIHLDDLEAAIRPDTVLITIMTANNEIGTIQPVKEIGEIARKHDVLFHTDAVQAVGHIPIDVRDMNIDMLSLSGHKFHAPKGVGALYVKRGITLPNLIYGGAQERTRRAGTENVAGIYAMSKALELACANMEENNKRILALREKLIDGALKIPYTRLNGDREKRLPGNANFSIQYIEGESILLSLDMYGIAASSGSACTSGSLDPSHVLLAIGLSHDVAHGSLRISIGDENTEQEIDYVLEVLPKIVQRLRDMSPLYDKVKE